MCDNQHEQQYMPEELFNEARKSFLKGNRNIEGIFIHPPKDGFNSSTSVTGSRTEEKLWDIRNAIIIIELTTGKNLIWEVSNSIVTNCPGSLEIFTHKKKKLTIGIFNTLDKPTPTYFCLKNGENVINNIPVVHIAGVMESGTADIDFVFDWAECSVSYVVCNKIPLPENRFFDVFKSCIRKQHQIEVNNNG